MTNARRQPNLYYQSFSARKAFNVTHLLGCPISPKAAQVLPGVYSSAQRPDSSRLPCVISTASAPRESRPKPSLR